MKTKILVLAALIGATALSANAGVRFGFSVGLPVPVVVAAPTVVAYPYIPAPVAVVPTIPVYAGPGYAWAPGCGPYYRGGGYAWAPGGWRGYPGHGGYYRPGRRW